MLDGKTQIKNGITYSKFESAPDAPFTVFETLLPQGPHSALTANLPEAAKYDLCGQSLSMPTEMTSQAGTLLKQNTKIAILGCGSVKAAKAKKLTRAQKLKKALASCRKRFRHSQSAGEPLVNQGQKALWADKPTKSKHSAKGKAQPWRKPSARPLRLNQVLSAPALGARGCLGPDTLSDHAEALRGSGARLS